MTLPRDEKAKLLPMLDSLANAVEEMLLSGLTTASEATRQTLNVSFQEAARLKLLRFGQTIRVTNEELGRFTRNEDGFSRKRLMFFLNRTWMLTRGLSRALQADDEAEWDKLLWMPTNKPCKKLEVVTLAVVKKVTPAFYAFDFRLRTLSASSELHAGQPLSWSCIIPVKPGLDIPAESFLHLPQKQKFNPAIFLEKKKIAIENALVAQTSTGTSRVALKDDSKVEATTPFKDWEQFYQWNAVASLERVREHNPGPFDLEVELQEEVVLRDWKIGKSQLRKEEGHHVYPISMDPLEFDGVVATTVEGTKLKAELDKLVKKKKQRPLYGLMHYEKCRLVLQPLALLESSGPDYLMVSQDKVDRRALVKTLHF